MHYCHLQAIFASSGGGYEEESQSKVSRLWCADIGSVRRRNECVACAGFLPGFVTNPCGKKETCWGKAEKAIQERKARGSKQRMAQSKVMTWINAIDFQLWANNRCVTVIAWSPNSYTFAFDTFPSSTQKFNTTAQKAESFSTSNFTSMLKTVLQCYLSLTACVKQSRIKSLLVLHLQIRDRMSNEIISRFFNQLSPDVNHQGVADLPWSWSILADESARLIEEDN